MVGVVSRRLTLFFSVFTVLIFGLIDFAQARPMLREAEDSMVMGIPLKRGGGGGGGGVTTNNYNTKPVLVSDFSGHFLAKAGSTCTNTDAETRTLNILTSESGLGTSNFAHRYTLDPTLTEVSGAETQLFIIRYDQVVNNPNGGRTPIKDSHIIAKWSCNDSGQLVLNNMEGEIVNSSRVVFNGLTDRQAKQIAYDNLINSPEYSNITLDSLIVESRVTEFIPGSGEEYGFVEKINVVIGDSSAGSAAVRITPAESTGTEVAPQLAGLNYEGSLQGMVVKSGPVHAGAGFEAAPLPGIVLLDGSTWEYIGATDEDGNYAVSSNNGIAYQIGLGSMPTNVADSVLPYIRVSMPSGSLCWVSNNPGSDGNYNNDCSWTVPNPGTDPLTVNFLNNHNPSFTARERFALEGTASYHGTQARQWVKSVFGDLGDIENFASPDLTDQDTSMVIRPDSTVAGVCNAEYDYNINELRLGRDGLGTLTTHDIAGEEISVQANCHNATFDSVIYHEFGHALHDWFGGVYDQGSMTNDGLSEGWSDMIASFMLETPKISEGIIESFEDGSAVNPGTNYVRTVDADYQLADANTVYKYGLVWASIGWHTREDLVQLGHALGGEEGEAAAKELAAEMFLLTMADMPASIEEALIRVLEIDSMRPEPMPCVIISNIVRHGVPLTGDLGTIASTEQCNYNVASTADLNNAVATARTKPGIIAKLSAGTYSSTFKIGPSRIAGDSEGNPTLLTIVGDTASPDSYILNRGISIRGGVLKLRGVTMENVPANQANSYGRAVFGENATLVIENSVFRNNPGGAVYNVNFGIDIAPARTIIRNSSFIQNGSRQDLALIPGYVYPVDIQPDPYPAIDDILSFYTDRYDIAPNQTQTWTVEVDFDGAGPIPPNPNMPLAPGAIGGAVSHLGGDAQITDSYFLFNQAKSGGAIALMGDYNTTKQSRIENNVIFGNLAFERGHCAVDTDGSDNTFCRPNHLRSNYGTAGGLYIASENVYATHNTIMNNEGGLYTAGVYTTTISPKHRNSIYMYNRRSPAYCSDGSEWRREVDGCDGGNPDATVQLHGLAPFVRDLHVPSASNEALAEAVQYIALKHEYRPMYYGENWNNPDAPPADPWTGPGVEVGSLAPDMLGRLVINHRLQPGDADYPALHDFFAQDLRLCHYAVVRNAGDNAAATARDIRGVVRPQEMFPDFGAYEMNAGEAPSGAGICDNPPNDGSTSNPEDYHFQDLPSMGDL